MKPMKSVLETPECETPATFPERCSALARRFARDEDGGLLIFSVYIFIMILMVGGIGVDLMRFERDRANLQYTLDRAVLAAADLDQKGDPEDVVQDYFDKAGLGDHLSSVSVNEGLGYRVVTADAMAEIHTQFMHMTGIDTLDAPASSTAEERIDGIEISLVLDVSGSMNSNNRLTNLKSAARDFIDNMVSNTQNGKLSISIVPYATQVSGPNELYDHLNVSDEHNYSNCVNFGPEDFQSTGINHGTEMERTMHFDPWYTFDGRSSQPKQYVQRPVCERDNAREMIVLEKNRNRMKNFISNLTAAGNTSIDVGMKWGTALLDPSMNTVISSMVSAGDVDADFIMRPEPYDSGETLKVVVLMTDGQNTSQYYMRDQYREGNSDVWWNNKDKKYSVYNPSSNAYYWPHSGQWADHPFGQDGYGCVGWSPGNWTCQNRNERGKAKRVTYADLWARTTLHWNARYNYSPWTSYNTWAYGTRSYVGGSTKNARTKSICDAAKDQGIIVFTIGFEAPSSGQAVLKDCASSVSHYFDVDGLEIAEAFKSIASSIRKLRLTQ